MTSTETDHERHVRHLLAELAATTPVRPKRIADVESAAPLPLVDASRSSRWPWLAAAAAVVLVFVLGVSLLTARDDADPFAVDAGDVPAVDTAALADGRLAFVRENDLFLADGATGEVRRITDIGVGEEVSHVSWSHDGEWLAFTIHDESGLWVVKRDGSERHRIGRAPSSYAWSPTADELAYVTANEVRVARVDGSSFTLEGGSPPVPHTTVVWSPDGESIAFARAGDELAIAGLGDLAADVVWNLADSPPVGQVLAWPTDDLILATEPDPENVQVLGYHPSNGGVQGLAEFAGPFDPTTDLAIVHYTTVATISGADIIKDAHAFVLAPPRGEPVGCWITDPDGNSANCAPISMPAGSTQPALYAGAENDSELDPLLWAGALLPAGLSADEKLACERLAFAYKNINYAVYMAARPQTLTALADSPVGLATFMSDFDPRGRELISRAFDGATTSPTRDEILDNITLYWLTNTAVSAARLYRENKFNFFAPKNVPIPVAVSVFPDELYQVPRSWAERAYPRLVHFNKLDVGGHFPAWEQPNLFVEEVRAGFRSPRKQLSHQSVG